MLVWTSTTVIEFEFSEGPALYPGDVLWWLLFACWNLVLIYSDLRYRRVPNVLIVTGFVAQLLWLSAAWAVPGWVYPPLIGSDGQWRWQGFWPGCRSCFCGADA